MHNPESVLENETHKVLWDFETQMDHLIFARQPELVIVNKKIITYQIADFVEDKRRLSKQQHCWDWPKY